MMCSKIRTGVGISGSTRKGGDAHDGATRSRVSNRTRNGIFPVGIWNEQTGINKVALFILTLDENISRHQHDLAVRDVCFDVLKLEFVLMGSF